MQGVKQIRPVDPILDQFGLEYRQAQTAFVADNVAPWIQTQGDTGTYYIADPLNNLRWENPVWSHNSGASRVDSRYTSAAFKAQPYGLEEAVPDSYVENWLGAGMGLKERTTQTLIDKIMLAREVRIEAIADALSPVNISTPGRWNETAANPRADIITATTAVLKKVGRRANTAVITGSVWDSITGTQASGTAGAVIVDAVKYTMQAMGSALTPQLIASYLNLDYVLPAIAIQSDPTVYETSTVPGAAGLPEAGGYIWDKDEVYVAYVDRGSSPQTVSWMKTFGPDMSTVDQYRDDKVKADVVRVTQTVVEAVTCSGAVYCIGDVLA